MGEGVKKRVLLSWSSGKDSAWALWKLRQREDVEIVALLTARPGWNGLRAVQRGRVAIADGNRYFNRSGMTVVETAEILAEMLHGVVVDGQTEGRHWRWLCA